MRYAADYDNNPISARVKLIRASDGKKIISFAWHNKPSQQNSSTQDQTKKKNTAEAAVEIAVFLSKKNRKVNAHFMAPERHKTIRQEIILLLKEQTLSTLEISGYVRTAEKEIYEHLNHIRKSLEKDKLKLFITPAQCKKCNFTFKKRERMKKPGKCPICQSEFIGEPLFSIK